MIATADEFFNFIDILFENIVALVLDVVFASKIAIITGKKYNIWVAVSLEIPILQRIVGVLVARR